LPQGPTANSPMKHYFVEGVFVSVAGLKQFRKSGKINPTDIEPFAKSYWVSDPEEALRLATDDLNGGQWKEKPKISQTSEEQRMRQIGAPELPGFGTQKKNRKS
jgi:hypothetical protein